MIRPLWHAPVLTQARTDEANAARSGQRPAGTSRGSRKDHGWPSGSLMRTARSAPQFASRSPAPSRPGRPLWPPWHRLGTGICPPAPIDRKRAVLRSALAPVAGMVGASLLYACLTAKEAGASYRSTRSCASPSDAVLKAKRAAKGGHVVRLTCCSPARAAPAESHQACIAPSRLLFLGRNRCPAWRAGSRRSVV